MDNSYGFWMERLLRLAAQAGQRGEVPVAAVVLDPKGLAIGWGCNRREASQDPLGHGELQALAQAARLRQDWRFNQHTLLVTLEPCPMCAGALVQARMGRVVYGASDPKRGALGSCLDLSLSPTAHHQMEVIAGVKEEACRLQLQEWFQQKRFKQQQRCGKPATPAPAD